MPRVHQTLELENSQGHKTGMHHSQLKLAATCHYGSDCYVQCEPSISFSRCDEAAGQEGTIELFFGCRHRAVYDASVSGDGAHNASVKCGGALACGVKECCGLTCGGVSLSFSGSGGGLPASAQNSGSGITYNMSTDDRIECAQPTPTPTDPGILDQADPDNSPIVVDLDRAGFRFSDLAGGVRFDLDGDGTAERLSWIAPGSGDGWLALDRDGDGAISTGAELFGNFTPQPASAEPHGFAALAVFDAAAEGGDDDGRISASDAVFADLRLWIDADGDGASRPAELVPLAAAGVVAIHLDHVEARRRDRHGNELRYTSRVDLDGAATSCSDVFLLRGD